MIQCFTFIYCFLSFSLYAAADLNEIEHIIIFMQENRAFDHYFGTLNGVRGFNDRITAPMKSGLNTFYQPTNQEDLSQYMLPFKLNIHETKAMCMSAPQMDYECDMKIWNNGYVDSWNTARDAGMGMSFFDRDGLPYYYSLYDHFAVGDQYFQSTFTQTNPNRLHLFSGSNGLSVGEDAMLDNTEPRPGFNWTTVGEVLEAANISWRVYQSIDNFDDNGFAWFANFQQSRPGEPLFDKGMKRTRSFLETFEEDLINGNLPQVSWIIAPTAKSEHATHHPAAGEDLTARILLTLKKYPEVYAKSVFILNYDEGGQFYDHHWVPTPPLSESEGVSTVPVAGEVNTNVKTTIPAPIGLGFRVPLLIVSPWTRGNIVISEVYDHISVIKLIEKRFGVTCPTISAWRRAITGDLTSAFDFEHPDYTWPELPDTSDYVRESWEECLLPYPTVPETQTFPSQEAGTRISRALPYEFIVSDSISSSQQLTLSIDNTGKGGAPFVCYDINNMMSENVVKKYAVEGGKAIKDALTSPSPDHYAFSLHGPNGFIRQFYGSFADSTCTLAESYISYDLNTETVVINLVNKGSSDATFQLIDNAYNTSYSKSVKVSAGSSAQEQVNMASYGHWYDFSVVVNDRNCYERRSSGRMETGKDSISDPAMASGLKDNHLNLPQTHPNNLARYREMKRINSDVKQTHKDSKVILTDEL